MKKRKRPKREIIPFPLARLAGAKGLSLAEVARRSGIPREYVSAIANGRTRPLWTTVVVLAEALGCSLGDFEPTFSTEKKRRRKSLAVVKDGELCSLP